MRPKYNLLAISISTIALTGCAGGAQEARLMPTAILCQTAMDLGPQYIHIGEYYSEINQRHADCQGVVGTISTIRIR